MSIATRYAKDVEKSKANQYIHIHKIPLDHIQIQEQGFGSWVTKHDDQLGKCFTLELTNVSSDTCLLLIGAFILISTINKGPARS